jgi:DNA-binding transcriptional LysR family regulator
VLADLREAEAEAAAQSVAIEGLLRVSAPMSFGVLHIAPWSPRSTRHPGIVVELGMSDRQVDLVEERWDMAVRIGQTGQQQPGGAQAGRHALGRLRLPAYLAQRGTPSHVSDLAQHDCLGFTLIGLQPARLALWHRRHRSTSRCAARCWPTMATCWSKRRQQGSAWSMARASSPRACSAEGRLVEVTLDQPMAPMGAIYAITHPARRPAAKTRAWIEFLAETVPAMAAAW